MAVALSPHELERTLEVLSNAGQTLQLTRFERLSYRALLVSVDGMLASFLLVFFILFVGGESLDRPPTIWNSLLAGTAGPKKHRPAAIGEAMAHGPA